MLFQNQIGSATEPSFCQVKTVYRTSQPGGRNYPVTNLYTLRRRPGTWSFVTNNTLRNAFKAVMNAPLAALLSTDAATGTIEARFMDLPTNAFSATDVMTPGSVTGDRQPLFSTAVLQLKTDQRGRNYKGSKHYAPIAESSTTEDRLSTGGQVLLDAVNTALTTMVFPAGLDDGGGNYWDLCIVSTTLSDLNASPCVFTGADVTEIVSNSILGTMRKRKEKNT